MPDNRMKGRDYAPVKKAAEDRDVERQINNHYKPAVQQQKTADQNILQYCVHCEHEITMLTKLAVLSASSRHRRTTSTVNGCQ